MNSGELPRVDFQFNSMGDLMRAHQEALSGRRLNG